MVRPLPHDRTRARRDFRRDGRQGQDREAQRRREPEDGLQIRRDVDPDADDLQGRKKGLAPGRRRAEAEAAAVDYCCVLNSSNNYFTKTAEYINYTISERSMHSHAERAHQTV